MGQIGQIAWNKGLYGEEYQKHYKNGFGGFKNKGKQIGNNNYKYRKKEGGKYIRTEEIIKKLSNTRIDKQLASGKNNPMYGKKSYLKDKKYEEIFGNKSQQIKQKQRESTIKYIKETRGNISPNIGKQEKQILDFIEHSLFFNRFKIIRQYYINGYYIDGYIPELKIAFEIDERPKINVKDIRRENEIKQILNCQLWRIPTYK